MFNFFKKKSLAPSDAPEAQPVEAELLSSETDTPEHAISTVQEPLTPDQMQEVEAYWSVLSARVLEASTNVSVQDVATG